MVKTIILVFVITLFSNYSGAQITFDYDKEEDFTKLKTYSFGGWQEDSDKLINDIDKKRLYEAFRKEFSARGMTFKEKDADAVVTFFLVIDQKTSKSAYTNYHGGMGMGYGYGMGYRPAWGWGTGYATTTYSENDYEVGTFVIDMYDTDNKKLVWQAVSQNTIKEKAHKREKSIPKGVSKVMKKYPIEAQKK